MAILGTWHDPLSESRPQEASDSTWRTPTKNAKVLAASDTITGIQASVDKKLATWGPQLGDNGPKTQADIVMPIATISPSTVKSSRSSRPRVWPIAAICGRRRCRRSSAACWCFPASTSRPPTTEAAGFPYAGTYIGFEAIAAGVFQRLATEWEDYRAEARAYLEDGDQVAAFGVYSGTYRATGKAMTATFAHLYTLRDGKIVSMEQVVDSALVMRALA